MSPECIRCGKLHGMQVQNRITGEAEPLDLCYDCIFLGCEIKFDPKLDLSDFGNDDK